MDCQVWIDVRAMDSIEQRDAAGALHEPLLRGEEAPLNEATLDTSAITMVLTLMMAGFLPGLIGETIHESHPDTWRTFQAHIQVRKGLKLNLLHKNAFSKNQIYCCYNSQRAATIRHPGATRGVGKQQSSWARLPAEVSGPKVGMKHPFEELVPVIVSSHTWYEDRMGRAGCAIVGDPRIGFLHISTG